MYGCIAVARHRVDGSPGKASISIIDNIKCFNRIYGISCSGVVNAFVSLIGINCIYVRGQIVSVSFIIGHRKRR